MMEEESKKSAWRGPTFLGFALAVLLGHCVLTHDAPEPAPERDFWTAPENGPSAGDDES